MKIKTIVLAVLMLAMLSCLSSCNQAENITPETPGKPTVTIMAVDHESNEVIEVTKLSFGKPCSVFDLTKYAGKFKKVPVVHRGKGKSAYIVSIGKLAEFDEGGESGWIYSVNNSFEGCGVGCASYKVSDGDVIQWYYTLDGGKDVGADFVFN